MNRRRRGLSDPAAMTARPRRPRSNPIPQYEDRQPTPPSHCTKPTESSITTKRSAPTHYDPDLATPAWEVYHDPPDEAVSGDRSQQPAGGGSANGPALTPETAPASASASAPHQEATQGPARSRIPPFRSRHTVVYAPDEASRIVAERMLRTFDQILDEDAERRAMAFFAGEDDDDNTNGGGATDDVIGRLQRRYAELTLVEEGEEGETARGDTGDGQQGSGQADEGQMHAPKRKRRSTKGKKKKKTGGSEAVEAGIYEQDANVELWLDDTVAETAVPATMSTSIPTMSAPASVTGPGLGVVGASFADRERARKRAKMKKRAEEDLRAVALEHAQTHRGITHEGMVDAEVDEMQVETADTGFASQVEATAELELGAGDDDCGTNMSISISAGARGSAAAGSGSGYEVPIAGDDNVSMEDTTDYMLDTATGRGF